MKLTYINKIDYLHQIETSRLDLTRVMCNCFSQLFYPQINFIRIRKIGFFIFTRHQKLYYRSG